MEKEHSENDLSEEEEETGRKETRVNKFAAFFGAEEGEKGGSKSSSEDDKEQRKAEIPDENPQKETDAKRKKKPRKKKKDEKQSPNDELDEIVRALNDDTSLDGKASASRQLSDESLSLEALLKVDVRHLDPDAELRRLLGRTFGGKELQQRGGVQRRQMGARLVRAHPEWPAPRQFGVFMVPDDETHPPKNGVALAAAKWFRFRHGEQYQHQQQLFWLFQRQMDHEGIMNEVLTQNPYHLDSLLLLSEVLTVQEDFQRARDTIERGIFACEFVFHSTFQPLSPFHRLDYAWRENRAFFLLVHRHLLNQSQRRCFHTALQFAKLLFGKDPGSDPLGLLLFIDSLALKGRSPEFLLAFYAQFRDQKRLDLLPNFLFSLPLAHLAVADSAKSPDEKKKHEKEAAECLEEALVRFPFVLSQILDSLQIQPDAAVERNYYLNTLAFYRETEGARLLARIYARHAAEDLWRPQKTLDWLERNTHAVLPRLETRRAEMDEWAGNRKRCFVGLPPNVKRHCVLHGIRAAELDGQFGEQNDNVANPCPPMNARQDYAAADLDAILRVGGEGAEGQQQQQGGGGVLGTFLRTLFPDQEQGRFDSVLNSVRQYMGGSGGEAAGQSQQNQQEGHDDQRDAQ